MEASADDLLLRSPSIRGNEATFRYLDDGGPDAEQSPVFLVSDSSDNRPIPMERDDGGWVLTRSYPLDARDEYCYIVDGRWILDPLNPFQGPGGFGPRSECRMPAYRPPRPMEPPVDGRMERCRLGGRLVDVYVPAQVEKAALLVVQDGGDYIRFTGMPGLIDALIREGAIAPTLAVFVSPRNREVEYHPNDRYVAWLAERVVPSLVRRYGIDPDPGRHGLVGASLGGSIATHGALTRPDVFRLVGAQSPAYRLAAHDGGTLGVGGDIDGSALRFHIDGGTLEMMLHGREFLPAIRRGVKVLRERGCVVQYTEVNEGHNWTNWRGRLPRLLTWLLG